MTTATAKAPKTIRPAQLSRMGANELGLIAYDLERNTGSFFLELTSDQVDEAICEILRRRIFFLGARKHFRPDNFDGGPQESAHALKALEDEALRLERLGDALGAIQEEL